MNRRQREKAEAAGKVCRLCGLPKPLRWSHIIPEFLYQLLYDDKHSFWALTTRPQDRSRAEQNGFREYLLCEDCEGRINVYEQYADRAFNGDAGLRFTPNGQVSVASGLDYKLFKLFQMSILWRASVASHPFFSNVALGPREEELRSLLWADDPGAPAQFSCMMWAIKLGDRPAALMIPPERIRIDHRTHYFFVFGGFAWAFLASRSTEGRMWDDAILQRSGSIPIGFKTVTDLQLEPVMRELEEKGRIPARLIAESDKRRMERG